jgi:chromosome segregation ATPase
MMMMEDYKKGINNPLKEIQENTSKQVRELNKTIQDLKMEVETIKKSQREKTLEIENLGKKSGAIDARIKNKTQEIEERISSAENSLENIDITIKENAKCKKKITQNIQETMRRPNLRIISIDEKEDFQRKGPVNIFNKIIDETFPNLKKEMPMNIQEAYLTPNSLDQKRNSSRHKIIKTPNRKTKKEY